MNEVQITETLNHLSREIRDLRLSLLSQQRALNAQATDMAILIDQVDGLTPEQPTGDDVTVLALKLALAVLAR